MTVINADIFNVYIRSSVPTKLIVKLLFALFNFSILAVLFWLAISIQKDGPAPLIFLLPVIYFFSFGKYLLWNTFGVETVVINSTHVTYQHYYGFWKDKLKTEKYHFIEAWPIDETESEGDVKLLFGFYHTETKLRETILQTSIPIRFDEWRSIFNLLNEIHMDEFGIEKGFPKIYSN